MTERGKETEKRGSWRGKQSFFTNGLAGRSSLGVCAEMIDLLHKLDELDYNRPWNSSQAHGSPPSIHRPEPEHRIHTYIYTCIHAHIHSLLSFLVSIIISFSSDKHTKTYMHTNHSLPLLTFIKIDVLLLLPCPVPLPHPNSGSSLHSIGKLNMTLTGTMINTVIHTDIYLM